MNMSITAIFKMGIFRATKEIPQAVEQYEFKLPTFRRIHDEIGDSFNRLDTSKILVFRYYKKLSQGVVEYRFLEIK
jgi:ERCC4-related helicase